MADELAKTFAELIGLEPLGSDEYISKTVPARMANMAPIAYGGNTLAHAVHAACLSAPSTHHLFSVLGHYLSPASLTHRTKCKVERLRDTKSFSTRRVQLMQEQSNGTVRVCIDLVADFHAKEPAVLTYYAPPTLSWSSPDDCQSIPELQKSMVSTNRATPKQVAAYNASFKLMMSHFEVRYCGGGVSAQNLNSLAKHNATSQDHLPITAKASSEWYRLHAALDTEAEQMAAMAFLMDGALSFLPLTHNHMSVEEVGACSTLDFAMRIFVNADELDLGDWCLMERMTSVAAAARTYSENKLWDANGRMIASVTQQNIMRPRSSTNKATL